MDQIDGRGGRGRDSVRRRTFLGSLAALPFATISPGRARAGVPTVGYISIGPRDNSWNVAFRDAVLEGLAEQGLVPTRNLRWLDRYPESRDGLEPQTRELMAEGADVIVSSGTATRGAIAASAGRVPVVYGFSGDPMAAGLADSLSRPRGNTTGVTIMAVEINAKRIELFKEMVPSIRRIALISNPNHPGEGGEVEVCKRTVASLGVDLLYMPVFNAEGIERALVQVSEVAADALVVLPDGVTVPNQARISAAAAARRTPWTSGWSMFAQSGALMTFGPSPRDAYRRVGAIAARVLAGAKPADLPIEQPTRFEFVVNLKTAATLGLTIPPSLLARADEVIE